MKKVYEAPHMNVELFTANQAVSTCTVCGGIAYTFDCMAGPSTDVSTTAIAEADWVSGTCSTNYGYAAGVVQAVDKSKGEYNSHSNNNSKIATWGSYNGSLSVTYSGNVDGLLYTDSGDSKLKYWSVSNNILFHSTNNGGTHHQVAPVIDSKSVKASW